MWLLYVSCGWVIGVFLGSVFCPPALTMSLGLIPFALIPFLPNSKRALILAGLCLLAFLGMPPCLSGRGGSLRVSPDASR